MKLADLGKANNCKCRIDSLMIQRQRLLSATELTVFLTSYAESIILGNHDEPSDIGRAFRAVREQLLELIDEQISDEKRTLERLGVQA